ncbi:MAG: helix-turn-helix transcriptional regulator [Bacteroidetes bacterium]|nr:helix-turn-helix transcriptional regulator [Bacteroidota bacterium]
MDYQKILIENIKYYRSRIDYTQAVLAEAVNVSKSAIGQIEIGKNTPSFKLLLEIADALKIEPYLLLKERKYLSDDNYSDNKELAAEIVHFLEKNRKKNQ